MRTALPTVLLAPLLGVLSLAVTPAARLAAQAPAPAATSAPADHAFSVADVEALARHAFEKFAPTGMAFAVVQDGQLLAEIGLGVRSEGVDVTPTTLFNVASCTKAFTAALMAQLVQEGKLTWDDRVVDHLPGFRMQDPWITAHMTIRDLLSHRCGLVTFAGDLLWYGSDYSDDEVIARIEKLPIKQPFRGQFGYQNLMYLVAGRIMERITGQRWEELVEQRLLRPLGMQHSAASAQRLPADAETALPHIDGHRIEPHVFTACKPAASIYSSVHELSLWIAALCAQGQVQGGPRVLDDAALAELWKPHVTLGGGPGAATANFRSYGLGWFLEVTGDDKIVEHDGGMPGFLSKVSLVPADGFGFVILNNGNDGILNEAMKRAVYAARRGGDGLAILDRIAQIKQRIDAQHLDEVRRREAQQRQGTAPTLPLEAYAGRYVDDSYGPAEVKVENGQLQVVLLPSKRRLFGAMSHWHDDVFRIDFPDPFLPFALFQFELDFAGEVERFRIDCPIADFDFGALDFARVK